MRVALVVGAARDDRDELPFGYREYVVAAIAGHRPDRLIAAVAEREMEPPGKVAVLRIVTRLRVRRQHRRDPRLRDHLPALPLALRGEQLADLGRVATAQARAAAAHRDAFRREVPLRARDAERALEHVGRERVEVPAG